MLLRRAEDVLVAAILVPCVLLRDRRRGIVLLASFTALGLLAVIYAWDTYELGRLVAGLLGDSGAEPLWDVLWATNHPASERTRRVVRESSHPGGVWVPA